MKGGTQKVVSCHYDGKASESQNDVMWPENWTTVLTVIAKLYEAVPELCFPN